MSLEDLCFLTLAEASRLIAARQISPVELTRAVLDRIDAAGEYRLAYIEVTRDRALADAARAEREVMRGSYRGPLHGIPVALKDLFDVAGLRTTAGSKLWNPPPAESDSEVARRFFEAGAVLLGKTNLQEFAYGGTNINPHYGTPPNPWDADRIPGGSSGGSAVAVAMGMAFAATGSDTGGSIRGPAAYCGITGLKPTFGRVSRRGVTPVSMTMDHVGPMTRTALDCALALTAMAGYDPQDPYSVDLPEEDFAAGIDIGISGRRIGVPSNVYFDGLEPEVEGLVRGALDVLAGPGAELVDLPIPWAERTGASITRVELSWFHRERLADPKIAAELRKGTLTRLWEGPDPDVGQYYADLQRKAELVRLGNLLMKEVGLIANPSNPRTAPTIAEAETLPFLHSHRFFGGVFNQTGQPSASIPCGFTSQRLPVGLMLTGALWDERLVLRAAHAYQQATDWASPAAGALKR